MDSISPSVIKVAANELAPGERIEAGVIGTRGSVLMLTSRRVCLLKRSCILGITLSSHMMTWPISAISGFAIDSGRESVITIMVAAGLPHAGTFASKARQNNVIIVRGKQQNREARDLVERFYAMREG